MEDCRPLDTGPDNRSVVWAFLDANIILEGRPVGELPWTELREAGTIRALIVPRAMEEIDAKKRDGRLGPHARAFNRLIAPAVLSDDPVVLREANPRVELSMAVCDRIPWDNYTELDPEDGDCRIVAEVLHARGIDPSKRILVSHDIKPLAYARGRGLSVYQASDAWLRPVEPSPQAKEIQRLKQQVSDLRRNEPSFEIEIAIQAEQPLLVLAIPPLTADQAHILAECIRRDNGPKQASGNSGGIASIQFNRDYTYSGRYRRYVDETVPNFANVFSEKMEMVFNQRLMSISVCNTGPIRAEHLVITVEVTGGWINDRLVVTSPKGPPAPTVRNGLETYVPSFRDIRPLERLGRHEFDYTQMPERGAKMEVTCEDFRNGNEFSFHGVIGASADREPLTIRVSLTAANLHGNFTRELRVEKAIACTPIEGVVDLETTSFVKDYAIYPELQRLLKAGAYSEIEWDGVVDDD